MLRRIVPRSVNRTIKWKNQVKQAIETKHFKRIVKECLGFQKEEDLNSHEPTKEQKELAQTFIKQVVFYHGYKECYESDDVFGFTFLFNCKRGRGYGFCIPNCA